MGTSSLSCCHNNSRESRPVPSPADAAASDTPPGRGTAPKSASGPRGVRRCRALQPSSRPVEIEQGEVDWIWNH